MAQLVNYREFTHEELKTPEGVSKLNQFLYDIVSQIHAMQGTTNVIKPDNDIDLQGKYKIINPAK
jgi:hypothetical protein